MVLKCGMYLCIPVNPLGCCPNGAGCKRAPVSHDLISLGQGQEWGVTRIRTYQSTEPGITRWWSSPSHSSADAPYTKAVNLFLERTPSKLISFRHAGLPCLSCLARNSAKSSLVSAIREGSMRIDADIISGLN